MGRELTLQKSLASQHTYFGNNFLVLNQATKFKTREMVPDCVRWEVGVWGERQKQNRWKFG